MLSYRHIYHAGNHADVLKHSVLIACFDYLVLKPKSILFVDTHASTAVYDLNHQLAQRLKESTDGLSRLSNCKHPVLQRYYRLQNQGVEQANSTYYGSTGLAQLLLREHDIIRSFELHPKDFAQLERNTRTDSRVGCYAQDGFEGLIAQLPPTSRRGMVLIDPSYELKHDYYHIPKVLEQALKRFATGVYAIWYPRLTDSNGAQLCKRLQRLCKTQQIPWLNCSLDVQTDGLRGSGMFVLNPPWCLSSTLEELLPELHQLLRLSNLTKSSALHFSIHTNA